MTRFERDLNGKDAFWANRARQELERVRAELEAGEITIDSNGVARNCIGRALMSDMLEKLTYVTDAVDVEATMKAHEEEVERSIAEYRANARPASAEQLAEMRAAFGAGEVVVDILTGHKYYL